MSQGITIYRNDSPSYKAAARTDAWNERNAKVTLGQAIVCRRDLERRGHRVPQDVDPSFLVGFHSAAERDGMLDNPSLCRGVKFLRVDRVDSARRDFGPGTGSQPSTDEKPSDPAAELFAQMQARYRPSSRGQRNGDDSMPANKATPRTAGVDPTGSVHFSESNRSAPRVSAEESLVPMRTAFGGGNEGFPGSKFAIPPMDMMTPGEDDMDTSDTRKAADAMVQRARDAWKAKR